MATRVSYLVELKMKAIEMRLALEQNRDLLGLTDIQCN